jgi:hypothetical protein
MATKTVKEKQMTFQISEHDAISGEVIIRDMTPNELAEREAASLAKAEAAAAKEASANAAAELKASAVAKLASLGLTDDEAKAIIG